MSVATTDSSHDIDFSKIPSITENYLSKLRELNEEFHRFMSIRECPGCYDIPGLLENYPFLNDRDRHRIYVVDYDFLNRNPYVKEEVLAATNLKDIYSRGDLKGRYVPVTVRVYDFRNGHYHTEIIPVNLFDFSIYHEAQHIEDPDITSETEINRKALNKYLEYYIRRKTDSYIS